MVTKITDLSDVAIVEYVYDDGGFRYKKKNYSGGVLTKTTLYVRDISGQIASMYEKTTGTYSLEEVPFYGSSRLGSKQDGNKYIYELKDHLGNVRQTIRTTNGVPPIVTSGEWAYTKANYYPFGMKFNESVNTYRYGYQGEYAEDEQEETGIKANSFQLRLYNPRLGRWLSPDPKHEFHSPYLAMGNNPISTVDPDGGHTETDYKNKQTGETVHVNDGINQVIEIDNSLWDVAQSLAQSYNENALMDKSLNDMLIQNGTLRNDLFYTIENVLEGKNYIPYNHDGKKNCWTSACKQNNVSPQGKYGSFHMLWSNKGTLTFPSFTDGVNYLSSQLQAGNSVMIGANEGGGSVGNYNSLTGHFFNVVGMGNDVHGNYFSYYDNGPARSSLGTNLTANRFYFSTYKNTTNQILIDRTSPGGRNVPFYLMTEVRQNR